ncbi:MAG: hypothetical protein BWZ03_00211 [bacterium ADurb.BinA186]|nr:MAG: hypothetical protein BWZ03_00211 [bacterium ADurb.BinA186]
MIILAQNAGFDSWACPKKLTPLKEKAYIILLPFAHNAPDMLQFFPICRMLSIKKKLLW